MTNYKSPLKQEESDFDYDSLFLEDTVNNQIAEGASDEEVQQTVNTFEPVSTTQQAEEDLLLSPQWESDKDTIAANFDAGEFKTAERDAYEKYRATGELDPKLLGYYQSKEELEREEERAEKIPSWIRGSDFLEGVYFTLTNQFPTAAEGIKQLTTGSDLREARDEATRIEELIAQGEIDPNAQIGLTPLYNQPSPFAMNPTATVNERLAELKGIASEAPAEILKSVQNVADLQKDAALFSSPEVFDQDGLTFKDFKGIVGRQVPQLAASAFTMGVGAYAQELGHSYVDNLFAIAEQKYGTQEPTDEQLLEIIERGEDEGGVAIGVGLVSGSLEFVGANQLVNLIGSGGKAAVRSLLRGEGKKVINSLGAASLKGGLTEALTEGAQGIAQDVGRGIATGKGFEFDPKKTAEEAVQGAIVGALVPGLGGAARVIGEGYKVIKTKKGEEVLDAEKVSELQPEDVKEEISGVNARVDRAKTAREEILANPQADASQLDIIEDELGSLQEEKENLERESFNVVNRYTEQELTDQNEKSKARMSLFAAQRGSSSDQETEILQERIEALNEEIETQYHTTRAWPNIMAEYDRINQDIDLEVDKHLEYINRDRSDGKGITHNEALQIKERRAKIKELEEKKKGLHAAVKELRPSLAGEIDTYKTLTDKGVPLSQLIALREKTNEADVQSPEIDRQIQTGWERTINKLPEQEKLASTPYVADRAALVKAKEALRGVEEAQPLVEKINTALLKDNKSLRRAIDAVETGKPFSAPDNQALSSLLEQVQEKYLDIPAIESIATERIGAVKEKLTSAAKGEETSLSQGEENVAENFAYGYDTEKGITPREKTDPGAVAQQTDFTQDSGIDKALEVSGYSVSAEEKRRIRDSVRKGAELDALSRYAPKSEEATSVFTVYNNAETILKVAAKAVVGATRGRGLPVKITQEHRQLSDLVKNLRPLIGRPSEMVVTAERELAYEQNLDRAFVDPAKIERLEQDIQENEAVIENNLALAEGIVDDFRNNSPVYSDTLSDLLDLSRATDQIGLLRTERLVAEQRKKLSRLKRNPVPKDKEGKAIRKEQIKAEQTILNRLEDAAEKDLKSIQAAKLARSGELYQLFLREVKKAQDLKGAKGEFTDADLKKSEHEKILKLIPLATYQTTKRLKSLGRGGDQLNSPENVLGSSDYYSEAFASLSQSVKASKAKNKEALFSQVIDDINRSLTRLIESERTIKLSRVGQDLRPLINQARDYFYKRAGFEPTNETVATLINYRESGRRGQPPKFPGHNQPNTDILLIVATINADEAAYRLKPPRARVYSAKEIADVDAQLSDVKNLVSTKPTRQEEGLAEESLLDTARSMSDTDWSDFSQRASTSFSVSESLFGKEQADLLTGEIVEILKTVPKIADSRKYRKVNAELIKKGKLASIKEKENALRADPKVADQLDKLNKAVDRKIKAVVDRALKAKGLNETGRIRSFTSALSSSLISGNYTAVDLLQLISRPPSKEQALGLAKTPTEDVVSPSLGVGQKARPLSVETRKRYEFSRDPYRKLRSLLAAELQIRALNTGQVREFDLSGTVLGAFAPAIDTPAGFDFFTGHKIGQGPLTPQDIVNDTTGEVTRVKKVSPARISEFAKQTNEREDLDNEKLQKRLREKITEDLSLKRYALPHGKGTKVQPLVYAPKGAPHKRSKIDQKARDIIINTRLDWQNRGFGKDLSLEALETLDRRIGQVITAGWLVQQEKAGLLDDRFRSVKNIGKDIVNNFRKDAENLLTRPPIKETKEAAGKRPQRDPDDTYRARGAQILEGVPVQNLLETTYTNLRKVYKGHVEFIVDRNQALRKLKRVGTDTQSALALLENPGAVIRPSKGETFTPFVWFDAAKIQEKGMGEVFVHEFGHLYDDALTQTPEGRGLRDEGRKLLQEWSEFDRIHQRVKKNYVDTGKYLANSDEYWGEVFAHAIGQYAQNPTKLEKENKKLSNWFKRVIRKIARALGFRNYTSAGDFLNSSLAQIYDGNLIKGLSREYKNEKGFRIDYDQNGDFVLKQGPIPKDAVAAAGNKRK